MSKTRSTPAAPTRKQQSRAQRDRQLRLYIRIAAAAVAVVVVGVIAFGVLDQSVLQPGRAVAVVNGVKITTADFEKHVRYSRMQDIQQFWQMQQFTQILGPGQFDAQITQVVSDLQTPSAIAQKVLNQMISDELVRQEAKRRNISASAAEVDAQIQQAFGYYPNGTPTPAPTSTPAPTETLTPTRPGVPSATATPTPSGTPTETPTATDTPGATSTVTQTPTITPTPSITPTPTPYTQALYNRDWRDAQARILVASGMTSADLRSIFEVNILRTKLTDVWQATPQTASVHARHILVSSQVTATMIIQQLQAGADFSNLASQYSLDTSTKDLGGDLGFFSRGQMVPEFEAAAFSNPVGLVPTPVQSTYGWHVIDVLEKKDETPAEARQRAFNDWLTAQLADPKVVQKDDAWWQAHVPTDPLLDTAVPPTSFPTSAP